MKIFPMFAAVLLLALTAAGHAAPAPSSQPAAALPKGHPALPPPAASATLTGKVLKSMDSGGYSHIYLQQEKGRKVWQPYRRPRSPSARR